MGGVVAASIVVVVLASAIYVLARRMRTRTKIKKSLNDKHKTVIEDEDDMYGVVYKDCDNVYGSQVDVFSNDTIHNNHHNAPFRTFAPSKNPLHVSGKNPLHTDSQFTCLLYTSDAADE